VLLWFILGYAFYSVAYAAVGALVSRQEDLTVAILPVLAAMIGGLIVAMTALSNPNGTAAQIAAFVPPFAPMVVPARVVLGDMNMLGLAATVALDLAATVGLIAFAGRVYERAILQIGAPVRLRRVLGANTDRQTGRAAPARSRVLEVHKRRPHGHTH
jgi:ABC-2 type transport system permease protein